MRKLIFFPPSIVLHAEKCFYFFWGCKTPYRYAANLPALQRLQKGAKVAAFAPRNERAVERESFSTPSVTDSHLWLLFAHEWTMLSSQWSRAVFPLAPYMASGAHPCTVWRGDSWCWRFTPALRRCVAAAELSASRSHPVSRRDRVQGRRREDLLFLQPLPWAELRFPE